MKSQGVREMREDTNQDWQERMNNDSRNESKEPEAKNPKAVTLEGDSRPILEGEAVEQWTKLGIAPSRSAAPPSDDFPDDESEFSCMDGGEGEADVGVFGWENGK